MNSYAWHTFDLQRKDKDITSHAAKRLQFETHGFLKFWETGYLKISKFSLWFSSYSCNACWAHRSKFISINNPQIIDTKSLHEILFKGLENVLILQQTHALLQWIRNFFNYVLCHSYLANTFIFFILVFNRW